MRKFVVRCLAMLPLLCASDAWAVDEQMVSQYSRKVVELLCKGDTEWLRCMNLDPLNCDGVSEQVVNGCVKTHVLDRAQPVTQQAEVMLVSQQIQSCIQSSFRGKLDPKRKDSPECKDIGL